MKAVIATILVAAVFVAVGLYIAKRFKVTPDRHIPPVSDPW